MAASFNIITSAVCRTFKKVQLDNPDVYANCVFLNRNEYKKPNPNHSGVVWTNCSFPQFLWNAHSLESSSL